MVYPPLLSKVTKIFRNVYKNQNREITHLSKKRICPVYRRVRKGD